MDVKKTFGQNLHLYRKAKKLSQEQLAEKLNISIKHLSTLETGKVFASAELIDKIATELHVSVSAMFYCEKENSLDESDLSKIDMIIEEEYQKAMLAIKLRIHRDLTKLQSM